MNAHLSDARWFTSSHSGGHGDCVEIAFLGGGMVGVRDSKDVLGPVLVFTPGEWDAFTARVVNGDFEHH